MKLHSESVAATTSSSAWTHWLPAVVLVAASAVVVTACGPTAWLVLPMDGLYVIALLLAAAGWGAWPADWLADRLSPGRHLCLAEALGLGMLSAATLALGAVGLLSRPLVCGMLAVGAALGAMRLARARRGPGESSVADRTTCGGLVARILVLLPLCVPIGVVLFAACLPPGVLWTGEARGYDVLEYHLQVPREYYEAGRIQFLPHNVYASFPMGVETLYLLLMYLTGGPLAAAIPAQLLHAAFGALTVTALLVWTPPGWPRRLVALVAGTSVWLAYLGALAYVELGVLFFAAVAAGLVVSHAHALRPAFAAGLCAGLSAGCKYTALVFVAGALGFAWLIAMRGGLRARAARLALYALGAVLAFSPWLIRNAAFTGNPVYPFAYGWFGGPAWSTAQAEQWHRGHALPPESAGAAARTGIALQELFNSGMYNQALWLLALAGVGLLVFGRTPPATHVRLPLLFGLWTACLILAWAALTRMPGRFALPVAVPLTMLIGWAVHHHIRSAGWRQPILSVFIGFALAGAVLGDVKLLDMLRRESTAWQRLTDVPLAQMVDRPDALRDANPVNAAVPPHGYAWMVGDARAFYVARSSHYTVDFNFDPWLEYSGHAEPAAAVAWLRTHGATHVVFSWSEIERLRRSYGFSAVVTPAWVDNLAQCGLKLVTRQGDRPHAIFEVYEVMPE